MCVSMPRRDSCRGVFDLIPRSSAATRNRRSPSAPMTYGLSVVTSPARSAPFIGGLASTWSTIASTPASAAPENTPARIAPRSRRCRVSDRVSTPEMPTMPWRASSSSRPRRDRQFDGVRAGSRTT